MDYSCPPPTQDTEKRQLHFNCFLHQHVCKNPVFHRLVFILLTFVRTTLHRRKGKKTFCVFMKNQTNMNIKMSKNWYLKQISPHTLLVLLKKSFLHDNLRLNNSLWGIHEMPQSAFTKFWLQLLIAKFLAFWNPSTLLIT